MESLNPLDSINFSDIFEEPEAREEPQKDGKPEDGGPHIKVEHRMSHRHLSRRASSEKALEDAIDWHFKDGDCYHCFSFGDVDFLSYIKHVVRQQHIDYMAISTWCMAGEDILELRRWHERGIIGRVDLYVGEIFKGSYPEAYDAAVASLRECGGRLVVFRNHSKIAMLKGERFDCLIESSANVNTNPRSENTVLTVDSGIVDDYIRLLSGVVSFDRGFDDVEPYGIKDDGPELRGKT